jgi:serine/threonine-protein kinase
VGSLTSAGLRFRVLRPHAKGGLGQVSVALDEELHREVALKEIQERYADDPHSRARFLLEAEITGGLEHPGVVPVYGLGCHADGRPFYAMRLIQGVSLGEAITQFHTAEVLGRGPGERGLAQRGLLRRFVDMCNAVAYAHSRGVLHRDLKPANVMLGPFGETLVVDWGLAKPTGESPAGADSPQGPLRPASAGGSAPTQVGAAIGTPAYMSPEQAAGRLDELGPASDVYSLGATLYHLLTGRAPFAASDVGEALRAVQRGDFPPPRQVKPVVPAALAAVCLKAMAPRPQDRYGSAKALAADVERWLADEPVGAYREPLPARLGRWSRRHRASVMSAAAALAVLALSLGVLAAVLTGHNRSLAAANARESEAKEKARGNFRLARETVKQYCLKVSRDLRLKQADLSDLRKDLLGTAADFHNQFKEQEGDDPELRAERAEAYYVLGFIAEEAGSAEEAARHYEQSLALFVPVVEAHPGNRGYRHGLAICYNNLGNVYGALGRAGDAEGAYHKALAIRQELADDDPSDTRARQMHAQTHGNLALWLVGQGRFTEAEGHYGKALTILQALVDGGEGNAEYRQLLADTRHKLGFVYDQTGRRPQAGDAFRAALAERERLHREDPLNAQYQADLGWSHYNLGGWYRFAGEPRKAEAAYQSATDAFQKAADARPSVPDYQDNLAIALNGLGLLYQATGQGQKAPALFRRALDVMERLSKLYPANVRYAVQLGGNSSNMGRWLVIHGDPKEGLPWFDKAQAALEGVLRRDKGNVNARRYLLVTHWQRADALLRLERFAESVCEWDQVLELNPTDFEQGAGRVNRAYTLARMGQYGQAAPPAEALGGRLDKDTASIYRCASILSLASAAVGRDAKRPEAERRELAERYAAGAVALLQRLQSQGYFNDRSLVTYMEKDKDIDPLRGRDDFKKLLAELEAKPKAAPK